MKSLQDILIDPTIPVIFLADVLEAVGIDSPEARSVLGELSLSADQLSVSANRLSVLEYSGEIARLMNTTDDLFLGFLDRPVPRRAFGVFALGAVGCHSLTSLVAYFNLYFSLFTDQFRLRLQKQHGEAHLELEFEERRPLSYRFIYQSMLLILLRLLGWFAGEELQPREVRFRFSESDHDEHFHYLFGVPPTFNAPDTALVFDAKLADTPLSIAQDTVREILRDNQNMMLVRTKTNPFTRQARRLLVLNKDQGWLRQQDIAVQLGITENLLWRKLKKEGTTYNQILAGLKRDYALRLLTNPNLSIEDVSRRLHFEEVSAFTKAFRKWLGQAPGAYRSKLI
ncbi:AraC family transcriptional regulator ligand-binding domain-containing protein [Marinobacter sp. chi1]|uniref:AraC family transcriptional regulator ligand-binding domain-containing protein n=1 Tax=Marinobacter suaedae TaxID=3057675 RepID=A0ABT8VX07_9GAMM|nr:AraC family transcriptional regulator [Marinobacter sp. chi1]MDO3720527.1 AraC family transcriptional regulator ligand-binding domain-containing protein [Marinobacter sp. chi1]